MKIVLIRHNLNRHGWPVSLVTYDDTGKIKDGFVLISCETNVEQEKYITSLSQMTGWQVEERTF